MNARGEQYIAIAVVKAMTHNTKANQPPPSLLWSETKRHLKCRTIDVIRPYIYLIQRHRKVDASTLEPTAVFLSLSLDFVFGSFLIVVRIGLWHIARRKRRYSHTHSHSVLRNRYPSRRSSLLVI